MRFQKLGRVSLLYELKYR